MLWQSKQKATLSPLMLMMLVCLVPFPILAVAILADRWIKPASKVVR